MAQRVEGKTCADSQAAVIAGTQAVLINGLNHFGLTLVDGLGILDIIRMQIEQIIRDASRPPLVAATPEDVLRLSKTSGGC